MNTGISLPKRSFGWPLLIGLICCGAVRPAVEAHGLDAPLPTSVRGDSVEEPESGVLFPVKLGGTALSKGLMHPTKKEAVTLGDAVLTGVGVREKTMFMVDVYAMGLYLEPESARRILDLWKGKSIKQLHNSADFYKALLKNGMPSTLRLVMCRDVDGDDMAEAFDESLGPRMRKIIEQGDKQLPAGSTLGSLEDLKRFRSFFSMDEVKESVELLFTWDKDGVLYSRVAGKPVGAIASHALCQSLFDIYLGNDPISDDAKDSMIERVPDLLKAPAAK